MVDVREIEQRVHKAFSLAFMKSKTREPVIEYPDGARRYVDMLLESEHNDQIVLVEIKLYTPNLRLSEILTKMYELGLQLSQQMGSREVKFVVVLLNIARSQFRFRQSDLRAIETAFEIPINVERVLIFEEDLDDIDRLRELIDLVPPIGRPRIPNVDLFPPKEPIRHSIFISYRRSDSAWAAGRLADYLRTIYAPDEVFLDAMSIDLGAHFAETIDRRIRASNILLVVIGRKWLNVADEISGIRRLDQPIDYVRQEIETALTVGLLVVPILLDDTPMPIDSHLPASIAELGFKNAARLRSEAFGSDIQALITRLNREKIKRR